MFSNLKYDIRRYTQQQDGNRYLWSHAILRLINPGFLAIVLHRYAFSINSIYLDKNRKTIRRILMVIFHIGRKIVIFWGKIYILESTAIGPGIYLSGKGGIIIGSKSIGSNVTVEHNVTIGMGIDKGTPVIGDNIIVKCDSVIYGDIKVASGSVVESSSVLSKNIPEKCLVKGNPARIIKRPIEYHDYITE